MLNAHRTFIDGVQSVLNANIVTGGSGPNVQDDGYTVNTSFYLHRGGYSQPLSPYHITSVLNKDLNTISFTSNVNGVLVREGSFTPSEKDRMIDEYRVLGQKCGKLAIVNLIEFVKHF
jgi:hypothetical protein